MENFNSIFAAVLSQRQPDASAWIQGNENNLSLCGQMRFYNTIRNGILISAELFGLPDEENTAGFYGMHIHEYGDCQNDFQNTGSHYNPDNVLHPMHAGDLPPLLSNHGYAWTVFYDHRFSIKEVLGRSVIIHGQRDDFTTQPSGNSGEKIGCGIIEPFH